MTLKPRRRLFTFFRFLFRETLVMARILQKYQCHMGDVLRIACVFWQAAFREDFVRRALLRRGNRSPIISGSSLQRASIAPSTTDCPGGLTSVTRGSSFVLCFLTRHGPALADGAVEERKERKGFVYSRTLLYPRDSGPKHVSVGANGAGRISPSTSQWVESWSMTRRRPWFLTPAPSCSRRRTRRGRRRFQRPPDQLRQHLAPVPACMG